MSRTQRSPDPLQSVKDVTGDSTLLIVLVSALVSIVTGFIPFSPIIGGLLAGWLVRDDQGRALKLGALSGLVISLPLASLFLLIFGFALIDGGLSGLVFLLLGFFFIALSLLYTAGLSALGGYFGVRLYQDRVANATPKARSDTTSTHSQDHADASDATTREDDTTAQEDDTSFDTGWSDETTMDDDDRDRDT